MTGTKFGDDPMGLYGTKAQTKLPKNEYDFEVDGEEEEGEYNSEEDLDLKKQAFQQTVK